VGLARLPVPDPIVRRATQADVSELGRLLQVARAELEGRKGAWLWERANARWASVDDAVVALVQDPWIALVGTIDDVIVGVAIGVIDTLHRDGTVGVVHGLFVESEARSVSVGDELIAGLVEMFRSAGCVGVDAWALPGERDTKNFYEAHGFSARLITVHHSLIGPTHVSRTELLRAGIDAAREGEDASLG
jgi:GNAT superfamily N-acetyltransferase